MKDLAICAAAIVGVIAAWLLAVVGLLLFYGAIFGLIGAAAWTVFKWITGIP
jgi:hypothetical protein